jgi:Mg-chelatase subunit ChlD
MTSTDPNMHTFLRNDHTPPDSNPNILVHSTMTSPDPNLSINIFTDHVTPRPGTVEVAVEIRTQSSTSPTNGTTGVNAVFVIDESGSMNGDKMTTLKTGLSALVAHFNADDNVGAVGFSSHVRRLLPTLLPQTGHNKRKLQAAINKLTCGGITWLDAAILEAVQMVQEDKGHEGAKAVIVLTDGLPNKGRTTVPDLVQAIQKLHLDDVKMHFIGYGHDHNSNMLKAMAGAGKGNFHYCANPDGAASAFAGIFQNLVDTIATGVRVEFQLTPNAPVGTTFHVNTSFPTETFEDGRCVVTLPDMVAKESMGMTVSMAIPDGSLEQEYLRVTVTSMNLGKMTKETSTLPLSFDPNTTTTVVTPLVAVYGACAIATTAMERANALGQEGKLKEARELLLGAQSEMCSWMLQANLPWKSNQMVADLMQDLVDCGETLQAATPATYRTCGAAAVLLTRGLSAAMQRRGVSNAAEAQYRCARVGNTRGARFLHAAAAMTPAAPASTPLLIRSDHFAVSSPWAGARPAAKLQRR